MSQLEALEEIGRSLVSVGRSLAQPPDAGRERHHQALKIYGLLTERFSDPEDQALAVVRARAQLSKARSLDGLGRRKQSIDSIVELSEMGEAALAALDEAIEFYGRSEDTRAAECAWIVSKAQTLNNLDRHDEALALAEHAVAKFQRDKSPRVQAAVTAASSRSLSAAVEPLTTRRYASFPVGPLRAVSLLDQNGSAGLNSAP